MDNLIDRIEEQRTEIERLKAEMETLVLKHEKEIYTLMAALEGAVKEIARLKNG